MVARHVGWGGFFFFSVLGSLPAECVGELPTCQLMVIQKSDGESWGWRTLVPALQKAAWSPKSKAVLSN